MCGFMFGPGSWIQLFVSFLVLQSSRRGEESFNRWVGA